MVRSLPYEPRKQFKEEATRNFGVINEAMVNLLTTSQGIMKVMVAYRPKSAKSAG